MVGMMTVVPYSDSLYVFNLALHPVLRQQVSHH
jgi:hypothetical protein